MGAGGNGHFSVEFEVRILACISFVGHFASMFNGVLDPRGMQWKRHELWAKIGLEHAQRFRRPPSPVAVREEALSLIGTYGFSDVLAPDVDATFQAVSACQSEDLTPVVDRVKVYCQRRALLALASQAKEILDEDPEKYRRLVSKALRLGETTGTEATVSYTDSLTDRIRQRREPAYDRFVPTSVQVVDDMLFGGLRPGKLAVVIAPSRGGKSTFLVQCGVGAMSVGLKVLHVSHEVLLRDLQDRYDTCLTGVPTGALRWQEGMLAERVLAVQRRGGSVTMAFHARGTATLGHYRALLSTLAEQGRAPDLVISDYPDLMADDTTLHEKRERVSGKYEGMFQLARETGIPIWCGMQGNRGSFRKSQVELSDIAEAWNIIAVADVVVTISATEEMEKRGAVRITKAKDRDRADGQSAQIEFHKELQRFA